MSVSILQISKLSLKEHVAWLCNSGIPHCICLNYIDVFSFLTSLLLTPCACFKAGIMAALGVFWFKLNLQLSNLPFPQIEAIMCYVDKTPRAWLRQASSVWFSWSTEPGTWSGLSKYLFHGWLYTWHFRGSGIQLCGYLGSMMWFDWSQKALNSGPDIFNQSLGKTLMSSGKIQGKKIEETIPFSFRSIYGPPTEWLRSVSKVKPMSAHFSSLRSLIIILQQPSHFALTVPVYLT